jgi:hypothetical protein
MYRLVTLPSDVIDGAQVFITIAIFLTLALAIADKLLDKNKQRRRK